MMLRRCLACCVAAWLQGAPLLARVQPWATPWVASLVQIARWMAGATAVSGGFHAVSGATGLTVTTGSGSVTTGLPIPLTNGVAASIRFQINSSQYGIPKTYTYQNLPPGLSPVTLKPDTVQGKPTQSGNFFATVRGWQSKDATGESSQFTVLITVKGTPPSISRQPASQSVDAGVDVTFEVVAVGEAPLSYQWFFGDWEINGTGPSLTLKGVTPDNDGDYRVRVDSPAGSTYSDAATLRVTQASPPPVIRSQSGDRLFYRGEPARLGVVVGGGGVGEVLQVSWSKDGVVIPGATATELPLGPATAQTAGAYRVRVQGQGGTVIGAPQRVTVADLPRLEVSLQGGALGVRFPSAVGRDYVWETRTALGDAWQAGPVVRADSASLATTNLPVDPARFIRVRILPWP